MSERIYLFLVGCYILFALYIEIDLLIYGLVILLLFEGMTDIRLTSLTQKMRKVELEPGFFIFKSTERFSWEAMRALRVLVACVLVASYYLVNEQGMEIIWFFPWFMGFAIMGAGASGVCPMMLGLKWAGFR